MADTEEVKFDDGEIQALVAWTSLTASKVSNVADLYDGVALITILRAARLSDQPSLPSLGSQSPGVRAHSLTILATGIRDFCGELGLQNPSNITVTIEDPDYDSIGNPQYICRLALALLVAALQCPRQDVFIRQLDGLTAAKRQALAAVVARVSPKIASLMQRASTPSAFTPAKVVMAPSRPPAGDADSLPARPAVTRPATERSVMERAAPVEESVYVAGAEKSVLAETREERRASKPRRVNGALHQQYASATTTTTHLQAIHNQQRRLLDALHVVSDGERGTGAGPTDSLQQVTRASNKLRADAETSRDLEPAEYEEPAVTTTITTTTAAPDEATPTARPAEKSETEALRARVTQLEYTIKLLTSQTHDLQNIGRNPELLAEVSLLSNGSGSGICVNYLLSFILGVLVALLAIVYAAQARSTIRYS